MSEDGKPLDSTNAWRINYDHRLDELAKSVDENTKMTVDIKRNTDEIVDFFEAGKGTFKFFKIVGEFAKWISACGAALALAYVYLKTGGKP